MSSSDDLRAPDRVLKRLFNLTNQLRGEYGVYPLIFSKELSFIAGEHACQMSTNTIKYGHEGFEQREAKAPLALAFTENIAFIPPSEDPGKSILVSWIKHPSSFSRLQGEYTHTGFGVAEREDGSWYSTQILATFKTKLTKKDSLLVVSRFVNQHRKKHGLKPLSISLTSTSKLSKMVHEKNDALLNLTPLSAKSTLDYCYEAEIIIEKVGKSHVSPVEQFLKVLKDNKIHNKNLLKDFTHMSFIFQSISENHFCGALVLGKCSQPVKKIPRIYIAYPQACQMLQLLNDYRVSKGESPLILSLQWCEVASRHSYKMLVEKQELETRSVSSFLHKLTPGCKTHVGVCLLTWSPDPLQEIFLIWISNQNIRSMILSSKFNTFGFGISINEQKSIYVTRIVGYKDLTDKKITDEHYCQKDREPYSLDGLSSDDDEYDIPLVDAAASFTLTN